MNAGTRLENYTLFGISFVAAILFFVIYPSQDPRSSATVSFTEKQIASKAVMKLTDLGFSTSNFTVSSISFKNNEALLDSLQYQKGREYITGLLRKERYANIKPFFWEVVFTSNNKATSNDRKMRGPPDIVNKDEQLRLRLDENGTFISLENPAEYIPLQKVQRKAINSVFTTSGDSLEQSVLSTLSDSLLTNLLNFDMQEKRGKYSHHRSSSVKILQNRLRRGVPYRYSPDDARTIAEYYLATAGWDLSQLRADTVFAKRMNSVNAAVVRFVSTQKQLSQQLRIDVTVAPAGALLQMKASYNSPENGGHTPAFVWGILKSIIIFGLVLAGLIMFFFRIRARSVDTQSALVAALVMGVIFPLSMFLMRATEINPFSGTMTFQQSLIFLMQIGFGGAFAAVGFFILFSIGDSITRQYWPQKLATYDYVRQGMMLNKPIGRVLLRSIALSLILCGFWTLILFVLPHAYLSVSTIFLRDQALWSPIILLLRDGWYSLAIILSAYLVVCSLVYGRSKNRWVAAIFASVVCGILVPVVIDLGPFFYQFLIGSLLGGAFACIYFKWDFLTLFLSHFLFLGFLGSIMGWTLPHSSDLFIFVIFIGFVILLTITACVALFTGKEEHSLPEYVPGYVEELAQEQRIKQELQIAREVQQSFLPVRIPSIADLDVAAMCEPAFETGGDYYDFIPLDEDRIALAIGDVSGKGIQAAFYMTFVKGILHSLCRETDSPAEVLRKANHLFYDNAVKGTFISIIYGIINLKDKTFTFARAGHNPLLHVQGSSGSVNELRPNGLGLGLTKDKIFDNKIEEIKLSIAEDDLFLLYTDGIVEALNQFHQFYGTDNLIRLVSTQTNKSASMVVTSVADDVKQFIGKATQHDDMTLMAIRFKKNEY